MNGAVTQTADQLRGYILRLEAEMDKSGRFDRKCADFPVTHFKAPGMIGRQMLIPKGSLIIGKIHKHAHLNQISFGHVRVMTEFGPLEFKGPNTFTSQPGVKRVVLALEDTLWTTFHLNPDDLDPDDEAEMLLLEEQIIAKSYEEFDKIAAQEAALLELQEEVS